MDQEKDTRSMNHRYANAKNALPSALLREVQQHFIRPAFVDAAYIGDVAPWAEVLSDSQCVPPST